MGPFMLDHLWRFMMDQSWWALVVTHALRTILDGPVSVANSIWTSDSGITVRDIHRGAIHVGPFMKGHSCWAIHGGPFMSGHSWRAIHMGPFVVGVDAEPFMAGN
jgi:hypothetical protein